MKPELSAGGEPGHNVFCGCDDPWCVDWVRCSDDCFYCKLDPNDPASHDIVDAGAE